MIDFTSHSLRHINQTVIWDNSLLTMIRKQVGEDTVSIGE